MRIFIDSADVAELRALAGTGLVDGVTTNPSLIAKSGRNFFETLDEICAAVAGPVSAEVVAQDAETMLAEARKLRKVADNIVVKLPLTPEGLRACQALAGEGHPTNVTLCFSAVQALLAAKAGATYISPFLGRLDDGGQDGMELIREIRAIYEITASPPKCWRLRSVTTLHVRDAALAGADCATIPPAIFKASTGTPDGKGPVRLPEGLGGDRAVDPVADYRARRSSRARTCVGAAPGFPPSPDRLAPVSPRSLPRPAARSAARLARWLRPGLPAHSGRLLDHRRHRPSSYHGGRAGGEARQRGAPVGQGFQIHSHGTHRELHEQRLVIK